MRLQCYDGMDLSAAAYEWDHARQLMAIRLAEAAGRHRPATRWPRDIYTREFLQARPLLSAIDPDLPPAVLLIDELDRADEPFEAFLLECWPTSRSPCRNTAPCMRARHAGGGADLEPHPRGARRDPAAVPVSLGRLPRRARASARSSPRRRPACAEKLAAQVVAFVQRLRGEDLFKLPGVAETIDWAAALTYLDAHELSPAAVDETLGVLLKYQDDIAKIRGAEAARLVAEAKATTGPKNPFG